jgi:deoxyhypusine synthase
MIEGKDILTKGVKAIEVETPKSISQLLAEMSQTGFQGKNLAKVVDVYGRENDYLKMTELIADFIQVLDENYAYSSREFLYLFGKWLGEKGIRSIVTVAAENNIPNTNLLSGYNR